MSLAPPSNHGWGCTSWGCAALVVLALVALFPVFPGHPGPSYTASCLSNLKQLSFGLQMYTQGDEDHLPPAVGWHDLSLPYVKREGVYVCLKRPKRGTGYAFNRLLDGTSVKQFLEPEKTPILFESGLYQRNGTDALQSFVTPHGKGGFVGFLDGHAKRVPLAPAANAGLKGVGR